LLLSSHHREVTNLYTVIIHALYHHTTSHPRPSLQTSALHTKLSERIVKMVLTEQLPPPPTWARSWPQQQPNSGDYMMDTGMMPYEPRPMSTTISRPGISSQYFPGTPFSLAPITTSIPAPQYQPAVSYASGYHSYSPSPVLGSPFKVNHLDQHSRAMSGEPTHIQGPRTPRSVPSSAHVNRSPSAKPETHGSTPTMEASVIPEPVKIIVSNVPVSGVAAHEFHTPLDNLMKTVQASEPNAIESQPSPRSNFNNAESTQEVVSL